MHMLPEIYKNISNSTLHRRTEQIEQLCNFCADVSENNNLYYSEYYLVIVFSADFSHRH